MYILSLALNQVLKIPWFLDMGNPKIIQGMGKSVTKKASLTEFFCIYNLTVSVLCLYIWVSHRTLHYKNRGHYPQIDLLGWCSFRHVFVRRNLRMKTSKSTCWTAVAAPSEGFDFRKSHPKEGPLFSWDSEDGQVDWGQYLPSKVGWLTLKILNISKHIPKNEDH